MTVWVMKGPSIFKYSPFTVT